MSSVMTRLVAPLCAALMLLSGCTGTSEPRPPTLLLVGAAPGGQPSLLLVEDVSATAPRGEPRLEVVPGASRPLLAPAVALDFEDRAGDRDAAWVLVRTAAGPGGSPPASSHLQRFTVADVDPADPIAFGEDASARVTLTEPGGTGVLDGLSLTSPTTCPVAMQVDRDGETAVVLDDPSRCGSGDHAELWLVPLAGGDPQALEGTNDVAALPSYLDQRDSPNSVYFLVDGINSTHVYRQVIGDTGSERLTGLDVPEPASRLRSAAGSGDVLIVLGQEDLLSVDLATVEAAERADTRVNARELVVDPTGISPEVLVLDASSVAFHSTPLDPSPDIATRPAAAATIDPVTRFGYAVDEGTLTIIDLLTGGDSDSTFRPHVEPLADLELPAGDDGPLSVVGWVRAITPDAP